MNENIYLSLLKLISKLDRRTPLRNKKKKE